jgi:hypothetical protein
MKIKRGTYFLILGLIFFNLIESFKIHADVVKDSSSFISQTKNYRTDTYSFGIYFANYSHNSSEENEGTVRKSLHANLYTAAFKWRYSLFEARFGIGTGHTKEQRIHFQYSHIPLPPNNGIYRIVENVDEGLFQFSIQPRLYFSNHFRLTPFVWLGYSFI